MKTERNESGSDNIIEIIPRKRGTYRQESPLDDDGREVREILNEIDSTSLSGDEISSIIGRLDNVSANVGELLLDQLETGDAPLRTKIMLILSEMPSGKVTELCYRRIEDPDASYQVKEYAYALLVAREGGHLDTSRIDPYVADGPALAHTGANMMFEILCVMAASIAAGD